MMPGFMFNGGQDPMDEKALLRGTLWALIASIPLYIIIGLIWWFLR